MNTTQKTNLWRHGFAVIAILFSVLLVFTLAACGDPDEIIPTLCTCTDNDCTDGDCGGEDCTCDDGSGPTLCECTDDDCIDGDCGGTDCTCEDGTGPTLCECTDDDCTDGDCDGTDCTCDDGTGPILCECTDDDCTDGDCDGEDCDCDDGTGPILCECTDDDCTDGDCDGEDCTCDDGSGPILCECTDDDCTDGDCGGEDCDCGPTVITTAALTIEAPVRNGIPVTIATTSDTGYTAGTVTWDPAHNPFQAGQVYTATVTLTVESDDYTFTGLTTATINGETADTDDNTGTEVTLFYEFEETDLGYRVLNLTNFFAHREGGGNAVFIDDGTTDNAGRSGTTLVDGQDAYYIERAVYSGVTALYPVLPAMAPFLQFSATDFSGYTRFSFEMAVENAELADNLKGLYPRFFGPTNITCRWALSDYFTSIIDKQNLEPNEFVTIEFLLDSDTVAEWVPNTLTDVDQILVGLFQMGLWISVESDQHVDGKYFFRNFRIYKD